MAQVPYSPVPNVVPGAVADPQIRVDTPPAAFGVETAKAVRGLGEMETRMAGEYEATATQMQSRQNDITSKQMYVDSAAEIGGIESRFYEKKGTDAVEARPQYEQDLKDLYTKAIANAPNAQIKQQLSDALSRRIGYSIIDGERHSGQQQAIANKELSNSVSADKLAVAVQDPWNATKREDALKNLRDSATATAKDEGRSDISGRLEGDRLVGMAWKSIFAQQSFQNPYGAVQQFNKFRDQITGVNKDTGLPYAVEIEKMINDRMNQKGSTDVANSIMYGGDYNRRLNIQEGTGPSRTSTAVGPGQLTTPTYNDIRAAHPELNLPANRAKATDEQLWQATNARTSDNQAALVKAGITPNMANTYMAHFLGPAGAVKFMAGLEANPDQPASNLVSAEAIAANRNVFYKRDGSMRTAQEVYDRQTAGFQGPGNLNAKSGADWLQNALDAAKKWSDVNQPNNPEFASLLQQHITTEYNRVHQVARLQGRETFTDLFSAVIGGGGGERINSMDKIWGDQRLAQSYQYLQDNDPAKAEQIRRAVENNMKAGALPPEQQTAIFNKIMGLGLRAETDPAARDEFEALKMGDINGQLSQGLIKQLDEAQRHVNKVWQNKADALERNNHLNGALSFLRDKLNAAGIRPAAPGDTSESGRRQTDAYDTFVGSLYQKMQQVAQTTGKPVTDQATIEALSAPLLQQLADPRSTWNPGRLFSPNPAGYQFQLPAKAAEEITKDFLNDSRNTAKLPPTKFQLGVAYQKALYSRDPDLRKRYGID